MKILIVALISLTEAFLHPYSNELIFRSADQTHISDLDRSDAGCRDHCEVGWTYLDETDACYKLWPDPYVDRSMALTYQRWDDLDCHIEIRSFVCKKKPLH
ncbi:unnamed protein product [Cylicocyclus nassatus]|uniref:Uncharacterized protein n=1 Tax=Cylicocyclus nassatus TaxID=53992 RepID=A0AA36GZS1_CYLNA|nr:unnamed protein product [Cylicocyclus nassatus]